MNLRDPVQNFSFSSSSSTSQDVRASSTLFQKPSTLNATSRSTEPLDGVIRFQAVVRGAQTRSRLRNQIHLKFKPPLHSPSIPNCNGKPKSTQVDATSDFTRTLASDPLLVIHKRRVLRSPKFVSAIIKLQATVRGVLDRKRLLLEVLTALDPTNADTLGCYSDERVQGMVFPDNEADGSFDFDNDGPSNDVCHRLSPSQQLSTTSSVCSGSFPSFNPTHRSEKNPLGIASVSLESLLPAAAFHSESVSHTPTPNHSSTFLEPSPWPLGIATCPNLDDQTLSLSVSPTFRRCPGTTSSPTDAVCQKVASPNSWSTGRPPAGLRNSFTTRSDARLDLNTVSPIWVEGHDDSNVDVADSCDAHQLPSTALNNTASYLMSTNNILPADLPASTLAISDESVGSVGPNSCTMTPATPDHSQPPADQLRSSHLSLSAKVAADRCQFHVETPPCTTSGGELKIPSGSIAVQPSTTIASEKLDGSHTEPPESLRRDIQECIGCFSDPAFPLPARVAAAQMLLGFLGVYGVTARRLALQSLEFADLLGVLFLDEGSEIWSLAFSLVTSVIAIYSESSPIGLVKDQQGIDSVGGPALSPTEFHTPITPSPSAPSGWATPDSNQPKLKPNSSNSECPLHHQDDDDDDRNGSECLSCVTVAEAMCQLLVTAMEDDDEAGAGLMLPTKHRMICSICLTLNQIRRCPMVCRAISQNMDSAAISAFFAARLPSSSPAVEMWSQIAVAVHSLDEGFVVRVHAAEVYNKSSCAQLCVDTIGWTLGAPSGGYASCEIEHPGHGPSGSRCATPTTASSTLSSAASASSSSRAMELRPVSKGRQSPGGINMVRSPSSLTPPPKKSRTPPPLQFDNLLPLL